MTRLSLMLDHLVAMFANPEAWMWAGVIGFTYGLGWLTGDACGFNRGVKSMVTFVASLNRGHPHPCGENTRLTARSRIAPICDAAIYVDRGEGVG